MVGNPMGRSPPGAVRQSELLYWPLHYSRANLNINDLRISAFANKPRAKPFSAPLSGNLEQVQVQVRVTATGIRYKVKVKGTAVSFASFDFLDRRVSTVFR